MAWFESVAEAQRRARRTLPRSVYKAILAGAERGQTYRDNLDAFAELGFAPHVAGGSAVRAQATSVMGVSVDLPVLLSPAGVQAVHPEAERAVARAAAARGTAMGLSALASARRSRRSSRCARRRSPSCTGRGRGRRSRRGSRVRGRRARAGLILTLDWTFSHARDWGSPTIPSALDLKTMARFAPEVALRPVWLARWARSGALPALTVPNVEGSPGFFAAYGEWMGTPPPSWEDLAWLRGLWDGPFMVKGVMRVDDARRVADDVGATALSVSNHGGNNLDGTPASVRALSAVVEAVGDRVEVVLDGGVRRGSDVVKALALGARAVMIGRPYLWGLAAEGQAGVENVLDVLKTGIDSACSGWAAPRSTSWTSPIC